MGWGRPQPIGEEVRKRRRDQPFFLELPDLDDEPEDREDEEPDRPEEEDRPDPDDPVDLGAL